MNTVKSIVVISENTIKLVIDPDSIVNCYRENSNNVVLIRSMVDNKIEGLIIKRNDDVDWALLKKILAQTNNLTIEQTDEIFKIVKLNSKRMVL